MVQRSVGADFVKGLMIVLVVYGHVTHLGRFADWQRMMVSFVYSFHMPIFLCITGFYFSSTWREFELRSLLRKMIFPYWLFSTLYLVALVVAWMLGVKSNNLPPTSVLDYFRIVAIDPRGSYWFLHSIIVVQLIFCAFRLPALGLTKPVSYILSVSILGFLSQAEIIQFRVLVFFVIGMMARQLAKEFPFSLAFGLFASLALLLFPFSAVRDFSAAQIGWALGLMLFFAGFAEKFKKSTFVGIISWLGENTLIILLLHAFFLLISRLMFSSLAVFESTGILYSLLSTVFTVAGCILVARILSHLRFSQLLFGAKIFSPYTARDLIGKRINT